MLSKTERRMNTGLSRRESVKPGLSADCYRFPVPENGRLVPAPMRMLRYLCVASFCSMMPTAAWGQPANVTEADVCVYGGTSGGVTAAVAAARLGKEVVLVEPGRHLGGVSSGGPRVTDNGPPPTLRGPCPGVYPRPYPPYTGAR